MRLFVACLATMFAAASLAAPASAQQKAQHKMQHSAKRTVQLISMTASPPAARTERAAEPASQGDDGGPSVEPDSAPDPIPPGFRVHDLSRRWVAFEMANNFASGQLGDASARSEADDPFAHVGVAPLGAGSSDMSPLPATLRPSAIPIPAWMRGADPFAGMSLPYAPSCSVAAYRPAGFLSRDTEVRRQAYYAMMSEIACQYGIPVGLFDAMIIRESRYQAGIYSKKNAFGLTQLMPDTAIGLGVDRYDVLDNLRGGARYLRSQLDRFGQYHLALAAYNAGPGRVRGGQVPRIAETQAYVDNVLLNWTRLSATPRRATVSMSGAPIDAPYPMAVGRRVSISSF